MPMRGVKRHVARLRKLGTVDGLRPISGKLQEAAELIQVDAQISITTGAVSGKDHVPSKPGEPPNNDTSVLANNIESRLVDPMTAEVSSNAPHAMIEWDWGNTAARPYMRPARDKNRDQVRKLVQQGLNEAVRRSRSAAKD